MDIVKVKIGVVGAGSWGTALANLLAEKGYPIDLWVFESEVCRQISETRQNMTFLPEIELCENLLPTNDLKKAISDKDLVLVVVPSHVARETALRMKDFIGPEVVLVSMDDHGLHDGKPRRIPSDRRTLRAGASATDGRFHVPARPSGGRVSTTGTG